MVGLGVLGWWDRVCLAGGIGCAWLAGMGGWKRWAVERTINVVSIDYVMVYTAVGAILRKYMYVYYYGMVCTVWHDRRRCL